MNNYETKVPRVYFGIAAAAMTAITFGFSVYVPDGFDATHDQFRAVAAAKTVAPAADQGVTAEVIAVRDPALNSVRAQEAKQRNQHRG